MDDFLMLLQAKLDEAKSKENINADIDKLQNQIDILKVQAEIDPKTISNLVKQLEGILNQKINISNININQSQTSKSARQVGQQIGQQISQGINNSVNSSSRSTSKILRNFSELNIAKRAFVDGHDLISKEDISDAEKFYDTVRKAFSEFGQVTVSKGEMTDGVLDSMRVKIEQVNDEAKITRDFMLYLNQADNFGNNFKLVDDDTIKSTEKMIQHLNEEKNIVNATSEEANTIKEKLAEQEKYYGKLEQASKEQLAIDKQRITAGEKQLEILDAQSKRRDSRISYNESQIDKKGLSDTVKQREINDLVYAGSEKLDAAFAKELDKNFSSLTKLKLEWQKQGIYVDEFKEKVNGLETALNNIDSGDIKGLNGIRQQIESLKTEASQIAEVNKIQLSIDNGTYDAKYDDLIAKTQQWSFQNDKLIASVKELETAYKGFDDANTDEEKIAAAKRWEQAVKSTTNAVKQMKLEYATDSQVSAFHQRLQEFYDKNTATHKQWGTELKRMLNDTSNGAKVTNTDLETMKSRLDNINNSARQANKLGKSWFDTIKSNVQTYLPWVSMAGVIGKATQSVKQMISNIRELDTALVDLKKTAKMSANELVSFYHLANDTAKQMGVTTKQIIEQASAWSRLGFNTADAATKMAKYSSMFATISPGMDLDSATDGLVSVMKAFKIGLEDTDDVVDGIMSKINIIGNTQAVNNSDIVDFLTRSSSAMAEANNTLEDTIALGTAITEITRDAAGAGQVLKTVSMRVRGKQTLPPYTVMYMLCA